MRVLIVSPWLPHPDIAHAGGETLVHTVRSLAQRGHAVHLLCYGRGESTEQVGAAASMVASLHIITPAYTARAKLASVLHGGWRRSWLLGRRTHTAMIQALKERCALSDIDVVHLVWTEMGRYVDAVPEGVGSVLSTFDMEARVRPRELALLPRGPARWLEAQRSARLVRAEPRYVAAAGAVTAVSRADAAALSRFRVDGTVAVTPPWLDTARLLAVPPERVIPGRLTFMGALDRVANAAAARCLLEEIWPRVRTTHPPATLCIAGAHPPTWLEAAARVDPRISVTGWVPDLAEVWAETDVAVCPSLTGGGLLLKVAQPMAAGRPVVTTSAGNEGIAAPEGAVAVADTPEAFARVMLALLADRSAWKRMAEAGRRHITGMMDWGRSMDALEAAYTAAVRAATVNPTAVGTGGEA